MEMKCVASAALVGRSFFYPLTYIEWITAFFDWVQEITGEAILAIVTLHLIKKQYSLWVELKCVLQLSGIIFIFSEPQ
jgi:hypothetical protein